MKEGSSDGASLCEVFHEGDLEGGGGRDLYTGKPKDEFFEIRKMPCKRISLSVGTLLGTWRGFVCRDF